MRGFLMPNRASFGRALAEIITFWRVASFGATFEWQGPQGCGFLGGLAVIKVIMP